MRLAFTILQTFVIACGSFIIGLVIGLPLLSAVIMLGVTAGLTVLTNIIFKIRLYDGVVHIDNSQETTIMQLEFCADPRRFEHKDELFFTVDTETKLVKGRRSNNELVEKALDEIEEFHKV